MDHRSIYNKWKEIFTYFDAIEIGLTVTPSELIERDTFRFFECEGNVPTYLYTYEQAVAEGCLVDFKVYATQPVLVQSLSEDTYLTRRAFHKRYTADVYVL